MHAKKRKNTADIVFKLNPLINSDFRKGSFLFTSSFKPFPNGSYRGAFDVAADIDGKDLSMEDGEECPYPSCVTETVGNRAVGLKLETKATQRRIENKR